MKKLIITVARQYGSGGREIGEKVANALQIPCCDKVLVTQAAEKGNIDIGIASQAEETATNSLLYTLAVGSNVLNSAMAFGYKMPLNDRIFLLQSDVIKDFAKKGSCLIIGRCGDYVLREEENLLRVFIYGDLEHRKERVQQRHPELKPSQIVDVINKTDRNRSSYYNFYTGNKWGKMDTYDLAINSSSVGIDGAAELIVAAARKMMES